MGFIRAALSAGLNSFNDSKFKEAIVLPDNVSGDALAVKGQLLTKDPDGRSRHSNQNTGLLSDGSVVIVPQGYTAVLVNNGTFLGESSKLVATNGKLVIMPGFLKKVV